jgi:hypothetical protein
MARSLPDDFDPLSPRPRRPSDRRWDWWVPLAAFILTMLLALVSGLRSYGNDAADLRKDLEVLKAQQADRDRRMQRIEQGIDEVNTKIDALLRRP